MSVKPAFIAALTAMAIAGPAFAQAPVAAAPTAAKPAAPKRDCFHASTVNGFRAADRSTVYLSVGTKDIYEVKLMAPSPEVRWTSGVALVSRGGGNFICSGLDADMVIPGLGGPQTYPLTSVRHLTPQQVAAIPAKQRP